VTLSPGRHKETPRRPDNLNCCLVHMHKQQSELSLLPLAAAVRQPSRSLVRTPTPSRLVSGLGVSPNPLNTSPDGQLQSMGGHPLSRSLVPEPTLCAEVSPTISSWYCSISHTSSLSFPASEVTFHVPRASL